MAICILVHLKCQSRLIVLTDTLIFFLIELLVILGYVIYDERNWSLLSYESAYIKPKRL